MGFLSSSVVAYATIRPERVSYPINSALTLDQWSWSTLDQWMAWCLKAPSHCLNLCWLIISEVPWHSSDGIAMRIFEYTNEISLTIALSNLHQDLPGTNVLKHWKSNVIILIKFSSPPAAPEVASMRPNCSPWITCLPIADKSLYINTQSASRLPWDLVNHFEWRHQGKNGSSKTPLTKEISSRICLTVKSSLFLLMA